MLGETVGSVNVSANGYLVNHTNKTTGAVVNVPTRVFHIHLISGAGGGSVLTISDGQTGTVLINVTGTASKGIDFDFGVWGITFPSGAFATVDANISNAAIVCKGTSF